MDTSALTTLFFVGMIIVSPLTTAHGSMAVPCPPGPDFLISPRYDDVAVQPGGSTSVALLLLSILGLRDSLTISALNVPNGITVAISKTLVEVTPPALPGSPLNITITASANMLQGDYYFFDVNVTSSHGLSHQSRVYVDVTQRKFSLIANPAYFSLPLGATGNFGFFVVPFSGFSDTIDLSSTFLVNPPGAKLPLITESPVSVPSTAFGFDRAGSNFTVATNSSTTPGYYKLRITGTDHSNQSLAGSLLMDIRLGPGFIISAQPQFPEVTQCSTHSIPVTVNSVQGFSGQVRVTSTWDTFSLDPRPSASPISQTVTVTPESLGTYSLSVTANSANTANISYTLILTGTSGSQNNLTGVPITVLPASSLTGQTSEGLSPGFYIVAAVTAILAVVPPFLMARKRLSA